MPVGLTYPTPDQAQLDWEKLANLANQRYTAQPKQSLEELTENLLICPPSEMIDKLGIYAEAGVDEIIISAGFGQTQEEMLESMHRISEKVIPYFKDINSKFT